MQTEGGFHGCLFLKIQQGAANCNIPQNFEVAINREFVWAISITGVGKGLATLGNADTMNQLEHIFA